MNNLQDNHKKKKRFLRNYNDSLITTDEELVKKWGKYFEKLLNYEEPKKIINLNLGNRNIQDCAEPTLEEIRSQINNLKNHKSPGGDEIQTLKKRRGRNYF